MRCLKENELSLWVTPGAFWLSWVSGWVLFSHGLHCVSSDFLCLKWEFLAEIMIYGPTLAKDNVSFYIAPHQTNLQRHIYQIRTGKLCQAVIQINSFGFLALLPREVTEQGCLCQQWLGCLGSSFLGNWTTAFGEFPFFSRSIFNKIRI